MRPAVLTLVAIALLLAGCQTPATSKPSAAAGSATRDDLIDAYLLGLEQRDAAGLAALVSPRVDARKEIAAALARYGGLRLSERSVRVLDEFEGIYVRTWVTGTAQDGSSQEVEIPISRVEGRFFLAIGQATPNGLESSPQR